jgi:hypothetical protein
MTTTWRRLTVFLAVLVALPLWAAATASAGALEREEAGSAQAG